MAQVIFADPLGLPFRRVLRDEIVHLLTTRGEDYWNSQEGGGSAQLYFSEDETTKSVSTEIGLNLTVKDGAGIYVEHHGKDKKCQFVRDGELDVSNLIRIFDPNEGFRLFPRCLFVPAAIAVEAVSYFFEAGDRSPKVEWMWSGTMPWPVLEQETERIRKLEKKRRRKGD